MSPEAFREILSGRVGQIEATLDAKGREYATGTDRLHNFKVAARITGETPAQVCVGFMVKHLVSVLDLVQADAHGTVAAKAVVDEKIGDAINYLILLEAILRSSQVT